MGKSERERQVLERLKVQKHLSLNEVVALLSVSESTARRIFNHIEASGKAIRTHGGIALIAEAASDYSFESLIRSRHAEKMEIGRVALGMVAEGDVLYLDSGTTILVFCHALAALIREKKLDGIQVFTNSLANLEALSPVLSVNLIGGYYRQHRKDFTGYLAETTLNRLHFNKCFLGTDGIAVPLGFGAMDFDTARLNQIVIENSDVTNVLCDSTKFGKSSLISFATATKVHAIVTDSEASPQIVEAFREKGVSVRLA